MEFLLNRFKDVFEYTFPNTVKLTHRPNGSVIMQFENMPSDFHSMLEKLYYLDNDIKVYFYKNKSIVINKHNFGKVLDAITTPCRDYGVHAILKNTIQ